MCIRDSAHTGGSGWAPGRVQRLKCGRNKKYGPGAPLWQQNSVVLRSRMPACSGRQANHSVQRCETVLSRRIWMQKTRTSPHGRPDMAAMGACPYDEKQSIYFLPGPGFYPPGLCLVPFSSSPGAPARAAHPIWRGTPCAERRRHPPRPHAASSSHPDRAPAGARPAAGRAQRAPALPKAARRTQAAVLPRQ